MTETREGIYLRINGDDYRKVYVVGDLHGCHGLLMTYLEDINFDFAEDLLISVGDLIDRGGQNVECLDLINQPWFRTVRGNHEQMAIQALNGTGNVNYWIANGGGWFFYLDYDQEVLAKALIAHAESLPLIIEVNFPCKRYVIAHADYPSNEYVFGKRVDENDVVWNRERVSYAMNGVGCNIIGADEFIFGHTPASSQMNFFNQRYIDTGAVFGHGLTVIQIGGDSAQG
ncbi:metallophosphoesterase [Escherichia coli]|nr:metallophosphoesterase [Escherichia coli]